MANSLSVAAGALNTYQDGIDMISNNLANASSTGFKDQTMTFADQVYQTVFAPSAPDASSGGTDPLELGLGVQVSSRNTDFSQGGINITGVNTDMAVNGNGFFMLGSLNGTVAPTYTRNGTFTLNENGFLIDPSSGKAVLGYTASSTGALPSPGSTPTSINIPIGLQTSAVGTGFGTRTGPSAADSVFDMVEGGNLDVSQWQTEAQGVVNGVTGTGTPQTVSTTIYDSLGNPHQMTMKFTPVATGATAASTGLPTSVLSPQGIAVTPASRWEVSVQFSDGTGVNGGAANASANIGYAYFDANGQYINSTGIAGGLSAGVPLTTPSVHAAGAAASVANGNLINITTWPYGDQSTSPTSTAGPQQAAIAVSYANLTSLSGAGEPVTTVSQDGYAQGTLTTFSVGNNGNITGAFSNGEQKVLGQVALATFENLQGLESSGNGQYSETPASGLPQLGSAGAGQFGNIVDNATEESNVSIATEFTKLIVMQNSYLANSKSITVSNQDLQAVDNLIA